MSNENKTMMLYKFRPLGNIKDFNQARRILETSEFWCSRFFDMNDPMEGVFSSNSKEPEDMENIFNVKNQFRICSFSGEKALAEPLMWAYYANGFKGIAIEINIETNLTRPVKYENDVLSIDGLGNDKEKIKTILTTKLNNWKHEAEYRFLEQKPEGYNKIGEITKVYFGDPWGHVQNQSMIQKKSDTFKCYECLKEGLVDVAKAKNITCVSVRFERLDNDGWTVKEDKEKILYQGKEPVM